MATQLTGRKRIPNREKLSAEDDALSQIAREVRHDILIHFMCCYLHNKWALMGVPIDFPIFCLSIGYFCCLFGKKVDLVTVVFNCIGNFDLHTLCETLKHYLSQNESRGVVELAYVICITEQCFIT